MSSEYVWATLISSEDLPNYHPDFERVFVDKDTAGRDIPSHLLPAVITHAASHQSYRDDNNTMQWRVVDVSKYRWSIAYHENAYGQSVVLRAKAPETATA